MNPILADIYSTILPSAPYIIAGSALLWVAAQLTLLEEAVADQQAKARAAKDE